MRFIKQKKAGLLNRKGDGPFYWDSSHQRLKTETIHKMPEKITEIKVFISCPSDVTQEKDIVDEVCESLSRTLRKRKISVSPIHWKRDVLPIITGETPQVIIDKDLDKSDYDIYVGYTCGKRSVIL